MPILIATNKDLIASVERSKLQNDKHNLDSYMRRMVPIVWPAQFFDYHEFLAQAPNTKDTSVRARHIRTAQHEEMHLSLRLTFIAMMLLLNPDRFVDLRNAGLSNSTASHIVCEFLKTIGGAFIVSRWNELMQIVDTTQQQL